VGQRRRARVLALQALYRMDLTKEGPDSTLSLLWRDLSVKGDTRRFAEECVRGVWRDRHRIDSLIRRHSEHWRLERMAFVDRNILRLGVYELIHHPEIPARVVINEAVELGKRFSTEASGAFINGVLDQIRKIVRAEEEQEIPAAEPP